MRAGAIRERNFQCKSYHRENSLYIYLYTFDSDLPSIARELLSKAAVNYRPELFTERYHHRESCFRSFVFDGGDRDESIISVADVFLFPSLATLLLLSPTRSPTGRKPPRVARGRRHGIGWRTTDLASLR